MTEALRLSGPNEFMIPKRDIQARVAELGSELAARYEDEEVTIVTVLKGGKPFGDDLSAAMDHPDLTPDSLRVKSYEGTTSTGTLRFLQYPTTDLTGRHLLFAEDMVDSGLTISRLARWAQDAYSPASLVVATMFEKPEARQPGTHIEADEVVVGMRIATKFVIGYGLDYKERYRELDDVVVCEQHGDDDWRPHHLYEPTHTPSQARPGEIGLFQIAGADTPLLPQLPN